MEFIGSLIYILDHVFKKRLSEFSLQRSGKSLRFTHAACLRLAIEYNELVPSYWSQLKNYNY